MARISQSGFEFALVSANNLNQIDGGASTGSGGTLTKDTTVKRTGSASLKCAVTSGSFRAIPTPSYDTQPLSASVDHFFRFYICLSALPASATAIFVHGNVATGIVVKLTAAGKLQLFNAGSQVGSDSAATLVADSATFYRVEVKETTNATPQITALELRLDGVSVTSTSGLTASNSSTLIYGICSDPGSTVSLWIDDFAHNTSAGAANNTWCGDGQIVRAFPISDNNRGAWVAGAAGTTNLFDAVNNDPPVGVADASATDASQIKNKSATNPSNCDLNFDTYTNMGVSGTVNALSLATYSGEDPSTGTKVGTFGLASNPAVTSASFNFGNDAGVQGTFLGLWFLSTVVSDAPSVTLGSAPVGRLTCTSGSTTGRAASICLLSMYVDYTPPAVVASRSAATVTMAPYIPA